MILAAMVPKNKNIRIYGSFNGFRVGDNSYAKFKADPGAMTYFISKNRAVTNIPLGDGRTPIWAYSPRGIVIQLRAAEAFYSHAIFDFVSPLVVFARVVSLQHGYPIKRLGAAASKNQFLNYPLVRGIYFILFRHSFPFFCHEVYSPPGLFEKNTAEVYAYTNPLIRVEPYARIQSMQNYVGDINSILFAPTFSRNENLDDRLRKWGLLDGNRERSALRSAGMSITFRPHPIDVEQAGLLTHDFPHQLDYSDSYHSDLHRYVGLITDVSSIAFDAMEIGMPVYFLRKDVEEFDEMSSGIFPRIKSAMLEHSTEDIFEAATKLIAIAQSPTDLEDQVRKLRKSFGLSDVTSG